MTQNQVECKEHTHIMLKRTPKSTNCLRLNECDWQFRACFVLFFMPLLLLFTRSSFCTLSFYFFFYFLYGCMVGGVTQERENYVSYIQKVSKKILSTLMKRKIDFFHFKTWYKNSMNISEHFLLTVCVAIWSNIHTNSNPYQQKSNVNWNNSEIFFHCIVID